MEDWGTDSSPCKLRDHSFPCRKKQFYHLVTSRPPIWQLAFWIFISLELRDPWNGGPFRNAPKNRWEIKGRFRKRVVLASVPSFRFSFRGNIRRNHPFGNHPFAIPRKGSLGDNRAVSKRVVLANVPSFRFSFRGNICRNHPFGNHPFVNAPKKVRAKSLCSISYLICVRLRHTALTLKTLNSLINISEAFKPH